MFIYAIKRLAALVLTFFTVIVLVFCVIRLMPGNVFDDPDLTSAAREVLAEREMTGRPVLLQLADYIRRAVFYADFGVSLKIDPGVPVFSVLKQRLPITVIINFAALALALPLGILLGVAAALGRGAFSGKAVVFVTVMCVSVPSFVVAALLQYFAAYRLGLAPGLYMPSAGFFERSRSLALPVLALALAPAAIVTRLLRAELIDAQNTDFMALARAKGLSPFRAAVNHGLRYAIVPLIPVLTLMFTDILAGSLVIERIFSIPGMGRVLIDSITAKDHSLTMAVLIFYTFVELAAMFLADLALGAADPRIRLTGGKTA
ncbi:MAG: ABC transporter permease [Defluviitaleaceae bacterium]|nr:ABC transporter permease [Defluviitaleaceae bacterium]MCL2836182.1 ABC transporter permease [Defluviitaleaceae bacterium]